MKIEINSFVLVVLLFLAGLSGIAAYILSVQNNVIEPLCKIEQVNYMDSVKAGSLEYDKKGLEATISKGSKGR